MGKPLNEYHTGDRLPELILPPLTRHTLALYCGGSGDHNPIHTDIDHARRAGLDDVIGHGMLSMAYVARLLTSFAPPQALRSLGVRFASMTHIGDVITCTGEVLRRVNEGGEERLYIGVRACVQDREVLSGEAQIAVLPTA